LESAIRNLRIQNLQTQLELLKRMCACLEKDLNGNVLLAVEREKTLVEWGALRSWYDDTQATLDTLERQQRPLTQKLQ
jgi:chaperonin cofactor prefoldin